MRLIDSYGLHSAAGEILFLRQADGETNVISPALQSYSSFKPPANYVCPHNIDIMAEDVELPDWIEDPFIYTFLPKPFNYGFQKPFLLVHNEPDTLNRLSNLCRLSSTVSPPLIPLWSAPPYQCRGLYKLTNLSPLVWTSTDINHIEMVEKHIDLSQRFNRKILFVGNTAVPLGGKVQLIYEIPDIDFSLPLEKIGAKVLREFMSK